MGIKHWYNTDLKNLCSIKTGKRDVNHGNPNGIYPFFTCAQQPTKIDYYEFDGEALLIAGNGFFNVKHYSGKFNAYQRTYVLQDFKVEPKYLYYFIDFSLDYLTKDNRGTTVKYIRLPDLQNHSVPIPPLTEQQQIVEKLDAILPKVGNVKERLEKIPVLLKKFRQSVLNAACTGTLTDYVDDFNVDKWKALTIMLHKDSLEHFGTIPEHWVVTTLSELSDGTQYGTSSKSEKTGLVPVLRMGNLQNGEIDWSDLKYTSQESEISKYALNNGDVLFNRTNSPELVGKTSIYRGERQAIFAGYLIKIRNKKALLSSEYLNICLNSRYGRDWCKSVRTDGVGQSNINATVLSTFPIPLPPIEEQNEIVRRVNKLFALADSLEAKYKKAMERIEKIEQSVLAKAFRGELVETDKSVDDFKSCKNYE